MPWKPADANKHTRKANSVSLKRMWARVANDALHSGTADGAAIRRANAAVSRDHARLRAVS